VPVVTVQLPVAHCWAACQACEAALAVTVPKRAAFIRAILAERERIANHLGDISACCNGFGFAHAQCGRLRELWQRDNSRLFGHRLLMDVVIPGGVRHDLDRAGIHLLREANARLSAEVGEILPLLYEYPSLQDRLRTTGELAPKQARALGTLGYVARASGECWDLRRDAPYPPYDGMVVTVPHCLEGDASGRVRVRGDEILISLDLLDELLSKLAPGEITSNLPERHGECRGVGLVEGWRGETVAYVHLNGAGRVARYFPLCNKSVNGSYSGHDL
jgi:Ni,Fe-hydrogenase III large subunit